MIRAARADGRACHARMGYQQTAPIPEAGFKFGR